MNYYCIACKVSKEDKVKNEIIFLFNKIKDEIGKFEVIFPTKQFKVKKGKVKEDIIKPLTPGYIFIKTEFAINKFARDIKLINDSYGLVQSMKLDSNENNIVYELQRDDLKYAKWIFTNNGNIRPSKITLEIGEIVNVISGPLASFNGQIIKVDKRNNKVCLYSENSGTLNRVWVPVEIVNKEDIKSDEVILKEFAKVY